MQQPVFDPHDPVLHLMARMLTARAEPHQRAAAVQDVLVALLDDTWSRRMLPPKGPEDGPPDVDVLISATVTTAFLGTTPDELRRAADSVMFQLTQQCDELLMSTVRHAKVQVTGSFESVLEAACHHAPRSGQVTINRADVPALVKASPPWFAAEHDLDRIRAGTVGRAWDGAGDTLAVIRTFPVGAPCELVGPGEVAVVEEAEGAWLDVRLEAPAFTTVATRTRPDAPAVRFQGRLALTLGKSPKTCIFTAG